MADSETSAQSLRGSLEFPSIQRIKGLRRSASANSRRQSNFSILSGSTRRNSITPSPRPVITRVDAPAPITTSVPALDVLMQQRMQRKDTEPWEASSESSSPTVVSMSDTASVRSMSDLTQCPPSPTARVTELLDALFPMPPADARLHHDYFVVATVDGQPTVPERYQCPTAMCSAS
ncbi:hypothetical protein EC988_002252, partial [Linderina pennispora]